MKGWRRLTPAVTRKPLPWPFWVGLAVTMPDANLSMAIFTLMCVSGYFRSSELLSIRRCDLVPPAAGVLRCWSILLFPEERGRASKTGIFSDSVELDDERLTFLEPVWRSMAAESSTDLAWGFSYHDYLAEFKKGVAKLLCPKVVPYQMRHSGPSIDLADRRRSLPEAQRRGRWAQASSMARYERRARLAAEWAKVPAAARARCEAFVGRLEELILTRCRRRADSGRRS